MQEPMTDPCMVYIYYIYIYILYIYIIYILYIYIIYILYIYIIYNMLPQFTIKINQLQFLFFAIHGWYG